MLLRVAVRVLRTWSPEGNDKRGLGERAGNARCCDHSVAEFVKTQTPSTFSLGPVSACWCYALGHAVADHRAQSSAQALAPASPSFLFSRVSPKQKAPRCSQDLPGLPPQLVQKVRRRSQEAGPHRSSWLILQPWRGGGPGGSHSRRAAGACRRPGKQAPGKGSGGGGWD